MKNLFVLAVSVLLGAQAVAGFKDAFEMRYQKSLGSELSKVGAAGRAREFTFDQFVDPANPMTSTTFKQRYWIDSSFAKGIDSPVILFLCGEWTCSGGESGKLGVYASKLNAHLVVMEHRYYGKSQPYSQLTIENLRFLSTANALNDFARLQVAIQAKYNWSGKWIVVGGSYSANLAAYYRLLYPNLVVGAYASSAPVKAEANFEQYDQHVAAVAGPRCAQVMRNVVAKIEATLGKPAELAKMKKLFIAEKLKDNGDFLYLIADMGALAIQYGYQEQFCKMISTQNSIIGYSNFAKMIYQDWDMNAEDGSATGAVSEDPSDYQKLAMRQWFYQSCTEYGYWQNAYHDTAVSVRSRLINSQYHQNLCKRLFNISEPAPTAAMNQELYLPLLDPQTSSRILFINGSNDPWIKLSITDSNGNNTNPLNTSYVVEGASHCADLSGDPAAESASMRKAHQMIIDKMKEWLEIVTY